MSSGPLRFVAALFVGGIVAALAVILLGPIAGGTIEWLAVMVLAMGAGSLADRDRFYGPREYRR